MQGILSVSSLQADLPKPGDLQATTVSPLQEVGDNVDATTGFEALLSGLVQTEGDLNALQREVSGLLDQLHVLSANGPSTNRPSANSPSANAPFLEEMKAFLQGNELTVLLTDGGNVPPELAPQLSVLQTALSNMQVDETDSDLESISQQLQAVIDNIKESSPGVGAYGVEVLVVMPNPMLASALNELASSAQKLQGSSQGSAGLDKSAGLNTVLQATEQSLNAVLNGSSNNLVGSAANTAINNASLFENAMQLSTKYDPALVMHDGGAELLEEVTSEKSSVGMRSSVAELQAKIVGGDTKQYSTMIPANFNSSEWSDEMSQKIVWLTSRSIQSAEVHLNPADLGPIDVKISIQNDAASVTFNAQNASVRELLESNIVRLREMMEANGLDLSEVNVDSGQQDQNYQSSQQDSNGGDSSGEDVDDENLGSLNDEMHTSGVSSNLVDYFA